ncbi:hypothetical protein F4810DRAFT_644667, partial [Camillea tinctor]
MCGSCRRLLYSVLRMLPPLPMLHTISPKIRRMRICRYIICISNYAHLILAMLSNSFTCDIDKSSSFIRLSTVCCTVPRIPTFEGVPIERKAYRFTFSFFLFTFLRIGGSVYQSRYIDVVL